VVANDPIFSDRDIKPTPRYNKLYLEWKFDDYQTLKINLRLPPVEAGLPISVPLSANAFALALYNNETAVIIHPNRRHSKNTSNFTCPKRIAWKAIKLMLWGVRYFLRLLLVGLATLSIYKNTAVDSMRTPLQIGCLSSENIVDQRKQETPGVLIHHLLSIEETCGGVPQIAIKTSFDNNAIDSDIRTPKANLVAIKTTTSVATATPKPQSGPEKLPAPGTIYGDQTVIPPTPYQELTNPFELLVAAATDTQTPPSIGDNESSGHTNPEYNAFAEVEQYGPLILPNFAEFENKLPRYRHGRPTNVETTQQYSAELYGRYMDIKFRTEECFDPTREWEQDSRNHSECLQIPNSFDPFTSTYNHGYGPHCEQCCLGVVNAQMNTLAQVFEGNMFQDLKPLMILKVYGAYNILRKWIHKWKHNRNKKLAGLKGLEPSEPFSNFDPMYAPQMGNIQFSYNSQVSMAVLERDYEYDYFKLPFGGEGYTLPTYAPILKDLPDLSKLPSHARLHQNPIPIWHSVAPARHWDLSFSSVTVKNLAPNMLSYSSFDPGYKSRVVSSNSALYNINIVIGRKRKGLKDPTSACSGSHHKRAKYNRTASRFREHVVLLDGCGGRRIRDKDKLQEKGFACQGQLEYA
jgi:hypothetical protein